MSRACNDYKPRRLLWTWITPYHLYHLGTKKCLTGIFFDCTQDPVVCEGCVPIYRRIVFDVLVATV